MGVQYCESSRKIGKSHFLHPLPSSVLSLTYDEHQPLLFWKTAGYIFKTKGTYSKWLYRLFRHLKLKLRFADGCNLKVLFLYSILARLARRLLVERSTSRTSNYYQRGVGIHCRLRIFHITGSHCAGRTSQNR